MKQVSAHSSGGLRSAAESSVSEWLSILPGHRRPRKRSTSRELHQVLVPKTQAFSASLHRRLHLRPLASKCPWWHYCLNLDPISMPGEQHYFRWDQNLVFCQNYQTPFRYYFNQPLSQLSVYWGQSLRRFNSAQTVTNEDFKWVLRVFARVRQVADICLQVLIG